MGGLHSGVSSVEQTPVTVAEIQSAVACEFKYALDDIKGSARTTIASWSAVVELSLIAKDTHNVVPGLGSLTTKVGDASLTATSPTATFDGNVEDKNTLAYVAKISDQASHMTCAPEGSAAASNGLGLADLLTGTGQILNSGGKITSSSSIITNTGIGPTDGTVIVAGTTLPVAAAQEKIPTVKFVRTFTVSRKVGGGLSFKVGDISLSVTGSGNGRDRTNNTITVTMGASSAKLSPADRADLSDAVGDDGEISLEQSIIEQRKAQLNALRDLTPKDVIVVNPAASP